MSAPKLSAAQLEYLAAVADKQELIRNLEAIKKQIDYQHCKVTRLSEALSAKESLVTLQCWCWVAVNLNCLGD